MGLKKVRYGKGKWNGFGGKVKKGESTDEAAIRELQEEANIVTDQQSIMLKAKLKYYEQPDNWVVYVYVCERWTGEIKETEEMKPKWYGVNALPLNKMWENDALWLHKVLTTDKSVIGTIWHDEGGKVVKSELKETRA